MGNNVRIVLADDHTILREGLRALLSADPVFEIIGEAGDGREAIRQFDAHRDEVSLAVLDVVMPGLNGFQATRQLTKDPETSEIPVIIVTTKDQETDRVWGLRQGARDFLTKPVSEQRLLEKVNAVLSAA